MDVAWVAMRVHVGRMRSNGGGGLTSLTLREWRTPPPAPPARKRKAPPLADTRPPPSKAPCTGTAAKRAAREQARGDVDEWVEQQQQRATWEVCAISAEAAQRDLEARLAKANEDRRAAEVERDALCRDKDRLTTKVKILEREVAQRARAPGGKAPGPTAEGEAQGPTAERGVGAPNATGARFLLAGAQAWPAQAEAAAGQM